MRAYEQTDANKRFTPATVVGVSMVTSNGTFTSTVEESRRRN